MSKLRLLADAWRADAAKLKQWGDEPRACVLLEAAGQLVTAIEEADEEPLSLVHAAAVCGYSASHLGRLVRAGTLRNVGRPNAPAIRRGDLPKKGGHLTPNTAPAHVDIGRRERLVRSVVTSK